MRRQAIFLVDNMTNGSYFLRGIQMADVLNRLGIHAEVWLKDMVSMRPPPEDAVIFSIKNLAMCNMGEVLKRRGNKIVFDPIDTFCGEFSQKDYHLPDAVIYPNLGAMTKFHDLFPNASISRVIHHHWDTRIKGRTAHGLRFGYVGTRESCLYLDDLEVPYITKRCNPRTFMFPSCHLSIRQPGTPEWLYKPATKVAIAAAVGANIITTRDPSVVELLGDNYPYYTDGTVESAMETVEWVKRSYGGETWRDGLRMMEKVKARTAIGNVAESYACLMTDLGYMGSRL